MTEKGLKEIASQLLIVYGGRKGGGSLCTFEMARALQRFAPVPALLSEGNEHLEFWRREGLVFQTLPTYEGMASFGLQSLLSLRPRKWARAISSSHKRIVLEGMPCQWSVHFRRWSTPDIRWVAVIHDADVHPGWVRPWIERLQKKIIRDSFALATVSDFCADLLIHRWGYPRERIIRIRHGMLKRPVTRMRPAERAALRSRLFFFGRIEPYKGLEVLAEAYRIAKSSWPELTLTVAGRGNLGALKGVFTALPGVTLVNCYLGENEVEAIFSSHGVCVLPYTQATQSGVAALALGHGLPIIASRLGGLPEQVVHGATGLLTPPGDSEALAHAILTIAKDEAMAVRMAEATATLGDKEFGWEPIMGSFLSQLRNTIEASKEHCSLLRSR
jgi:glycosyltransferase involved in cell wall biosynthesis